MITIVSEQQAIKYANLYRSGMGITELTRVAKVGHEKLKEILESQGVEIRSATDQRYGKMRHEYPVNNKICDKCQYKNRAHAENMCTYSLVEGKLKDMTQVSYEHCPYFKKRGKKR